MKTVEKIAMRCTRAEYKSIKKFVGKMENPGPEDFKKYNYLLNYSDGTVQIYDKSMGGRKIYETFDKDIFLKACGIEISKTEILEEFNKRLGDKRIAMFKKAQSVVSGLSAAHCNITYIGTDSGYALNPEGETELDGSFTITITGNKNK